MKNEKCKMRCLKTHIKPKPEIPKGEMFTLTGPFDEISYQKLQRIGKYAILEEVRIRNKRTIKNHSKIKV